MSRKLLLLWLLALLMATLNVAMRVEKAKASGTIYIRADGSIDPPTTPIYTVGNVTYTLTGNITSDAGGVVVERSNIIIDGQGHFIRGNLTESGYGISWSNIDNVTVRNINIEDCNVGIYVERSSNSRIIGNNFTNGYVNSLALRISNSSGTKIDRNLIQQRFIQGLINGPGNEGVALIFSNESIISNNAIGVEWDWYMLYGGTALLLDSSSNNTIIQNDINTSRVAVRIVSSANNKVYHNNFLRESGQVVTDESQNAWDDGYGSGGNYWSGHICNGNPSNGSQPYTINTQNLDHYPFQYPKGWLKVHNANSGLSYATIQEAINAKETLNGHTIVADAGVYYENVVVNKTLSLVGENRDTTIIDGGSAWDSVTVTITVNNVVFRGFTTNASAPLSYNMLLNKTTSNLITNNNMMGSNFGVRVQASTNATITRNSIRGTGVDVVVSESSYVFIGENNITPPEEGAMAGGISLWDSSNCIVASNNLTSIDYRAIGLSESFNNTVTGNNMTGYEDPSLGVTGCGILIGGDAPGENASSYNSFYDNTIENFHYAIAAGLIIGEGEHHDNIFLRNNIENNYYGLYWHNSSNNDNNILYHNNFMNNTFQAKNRDAVIVWNNGYPSGGNYWSNYTGSDFDHDGIGDTPHVIDGNNTDNYPLMGMFTDFNAASERHVQTICNSTISDFQFNGTSIGFNVSGDNGTTGFCRICIPTALMNAAYRVFVNGTEVQCNLLPCSNSTHSYLYFTYSHSTEQIVIVPEFLSFIILSLFMIVTLLAVVGHRRKRN